MVRPYFALAQDKYDAIEIGASSCGPTGLEHATNCLEIVGTGFWGLG